MDNEFVKLFDLPGKIEQAIEICSEIGLVYTEEQAQSELSTLFDGDIPLEVTDVFNDYVRDYHECKGEKVFELIEDVLNKYHYVETTKISIYGIMWNITQVQLRALQVLIKTLPPDKSKELRDNIVIYKDHNSHEDDSSQQIHICSDGYLDDTFDSGFFNIESNLSFSLID